MGLLNKIIKSILNFGKAMCPVLLKLKRIQRKRAVVFDMETNRFGFSNM
jgi:hypothetical protein